MNKRQYKKKCKKRWMFFLFHHKKYTFLKRIKRQAKEYDTFYKKRCKRFEELVYTGEIIEDD